MDHQNIIVMPINPVGKEVTTLLYYYYYHYTVNMIDNIFCLKQHYSVLV